jgi:glucose uptake protein GlcU
MLREELRRMTTWSERHRRLLARVIIALCLSVAVDAVCATLMWSYERGLIGSSIHGFGDAFFFSSAQIVSVSSSSTNPVTNAGQIVDIVSEVWGIFVCTAIAGSFASFFTSSDQS